MHFRTKKSSGPTNEFALGLQELHQLAWLEDVRIYDYRHDSGI